MTCKTSAEKEPPKEPSLRELLENMAGKGQLIYQEINNCTGVPHKKILSVIMNTGLTDKQKQLLLEAIFS